jgi:hypothetical protein
MSKIINNSTRANNSFWFTSRIFGVYIQYVLTLILAIGIFIGIKNDSNPGLYGIVVVFLLQFADYTQWILR